MTDDAPAPNQTWLAPRFRLSILLATLATVIGTFAYVGTRPPGPKRIDASINSGQLWGMPRKYADRLFRQQPKYIPVGHEGSSPDLWLYKAGSNPVTYYLVRVNHDRIIDVEPADEYGNPIPSENLP